MYRKHIETANHFFRNNPDAHNDAVLLLPSFDGDVTKVAQALSKRYGEEVSDKQIKLNWKCLNPSYARGTFFLEEDALLVVTMELFQDEILHNNFKAVNELLPWRHSTIWKKRACNIFHTLTAKWSMLVHKYEYTQ
jgi:hypothetical protein